MENIYSNGVVILDFGSQYTQLIARRVREFNVYSEILSPETSSKEILDLKPKALILSGGPSSVYEKSAPTFDETIFSMDIPILGICYGLHLMVNHYGGKIESSSQGEYGSASIDIAEMKGLFYSINSQSNVWMSHGDKVTKLPENWVATSYSSNDIIGSLQNEKKDRIAVQFHPEVAHTDEGSQILENFLFRISDCSKNWTIGHFIDDQIKNIRSQTEGKHVLLGLSGGVDSTVVAALLGKAIGKRARGVLIDHGLMRKDEAKSSIRKLNKILPFDIN